MKKLLCLLAASALVLGGCSKYDDDALWDSVNGLEERVGSLETAVQQMNSDIAAMSAIVSSMEQSTYIQSVETITGGFKISFSDGNSYSIISGADGQSPVISIKAEEGVYYWTIDGEWLLKDGTVSPTADPADRLSVTGFNPVIGVDAAGYWTITVNGVTKRILDANEQPVKAKGEGDSFFKAVDVTSSPGFAIFTMVDNSTITVPIGESLMFPGAPGYLFNAVTGGTSSLAFTKTPGIVKVGIANPLPVGWSVAVDNAAGRIDITAPAGAASIEMLVVGTTNYGSSASYWLTVSTYEANLQTLVDNTPLGGTLTLDKPAYSAGTGVTINKNITITGVNNPTITAINPTKIQPGGPIPFDVGRHDGQAPAILITDGAVVTISGITLSSIDMLTKDPVADGITVVDSELTLDGVTIDKVGKMDQNGNFLITRTQKARGVVGYNSTVMAIDCKFTNIMKTGLHMTAGGTAFISRCEFTGCGPTNLTAQNGAVFMGANTAGYIQDSSFFDFSYETDATMGIAVSAYDGATVDDEGGNTFSENNVDWFPTI